MTSASVLSSDHANSKSTGVLNAAVNSNVASQNTAAVPSSSSLSMSSSKDFHSSTLAISSSPFEVLSAGMANKQTIAPLTLVSSELVTSSVLVSTSVVPSSALSRSDSSSVATMSSNLITEQGTSAVTSVSSLLLSSSTISASSLQQSHLTAVVVGTTLAIGKTRLKHPHRLLCCLHLKRWCRNSQVRYFQIISSRYNEHYSRTSTCDHLCCKQHPHLSDHVSKLPKFPQSEPYK